MTRQDWIREAVAVALLVAATVFLVIVVNAT